MITLFSRNLSWCNFFFTFILSAISLNLHTKIKFCKFSWHTWRVQSAHYVLWNLVWETLFLIFSKDVDISWQIYSNSFWLSLFFLRIFSHCLPQRSFLSYYLLVQVKSPKFLGFLSNSLAFSVFHTILPFSFCLKSTVIPGYSTFFLAVPP